MGDDFAAFEKDRVEYARQDESYASKFAALRGGMFGQISSEILSGKAFDTTMSGNLRKLLSGAGFDQGEADKIVRTMGVASKFAKGNVASVAGTLEEAGISVSANDWAQMNTWGEQLGPQALSMSSKQITDEINRLKDVGGEDNIKKADLLGRAAAGGFIGDSGTASRTAKQVFGSQLSGMGDKWDSTKVQRLIAKNLTGTAIDDVTNARLAEADKTFLDRIAEINAESSATGGKQLNNLSGAANAIADWNDSATGESMATRFAKLKGMDASTMTADQKTEYESLGKLNTAITGYGQTKEQITGAGNMLKAQANQAVNIEKISEWLQKLVPVGNHAGAIVNALQAIAGALKAAIGGTST